ncbi:glycosyltransferase family 2 protein [Bacteroides acidifaciens]|nr:glycosyltransferase family 2 protein [Bacteroides acidifaciens]
MNVLPPPPRQVYLCNGDYSHWVGLNNDSLVSVITPIYNVENYLNECIDSLIRQTYTNLEIHQGRLRFSHKELKTEINKEMLTIKGHYSKALILKLKILLSMPFLAKALFR